MKKTGIALLAGGLFFATSAFIFLNNQAYCAQDDGCITSEEK